MNNTQITHPVGVHQFFEHQAERTPSAQALIHGDRTWTYEQLSRTVNALTSQLIREGVGAQTPVGVCMHRSHAMIVAMLAVLKAGGSYVPLDPAYPQSRLTFILEDAETPILITQKSAFEKVDAWAENRGIHPIFLEENGAWSSAQAEAIPSRETHPRERAYVIYTSGSTGKPKGVAVTHGNAAALMVWAQHQFTASQMAGVLASTSICFDLSIFEVFATLARGGAVVLASHLLELPELPARHKVTLINTVPSAMTELLALQGVPSSVQVVNLAGEPFQQSLIHRIYQRPGMEAVYNLYGPSEDTTYSTGTLLEPEPDAVPHIGVPIQGTYGQVLNERFEKVGWGEAGELLLGGAGLSPGYHNRAALTAERFIPNPFSTPETSPGDRLYRTGDLVQLRKDGTMLFLGRLDHQVKIRGFRIELGEIESALGSQPTVERALVTALEDKGQKQLVAFIQTPNNSGDPDELRKTMERKLPSYMVPSRFIFLEQFPLTPNGKIDRKKLIQAAPKKERPLKTPYAAPRTDEERELVQLWSDILDIPQIGVHDPFLSLGGHSLQATRIISRLPMGAKPSLAFFFKNPTVADLAAELARPSGYHSEGPPITPLPRPNGLPEPGPLSFSQQRAWFFERFAAGNSGYNVISVWRMNGPLNREILCQAMAQLHQRHETLRTLFAERDGVPVQIPQPADDPPFIRFEDLEGEEDAETRAGDIRTADAQTGFNLEKGPLTRWTLIRTSATQHILQIVMHHIVTDGWSMEVLRNELALIYEALLNQRSTSLKPISVQFLDVAHWQQQWLKSEEAERQGRYWREQLQGELPVSPTEKPRPQALSFRCWSQPVQVSPSFTRQLNAFCAREGVSLFMLLLTAFKILRAGFLRETRLLTGTAIANRNRHAFEGVVGYFVNTLVVDSQILRNLSFRNVLNQVKETMLNGYANQDYPFDKLVDELNPERSITSHNPLFQSMFILHNQEGAPHPLPGLELSELEVPRQFSSFDLNLTLWERPTSEGKMLKGNLIYQSQLFQTATVKAMTQTWLDLLAHMISHPDGEVGQFPVEPCVEALAVGSREITGPVPIGQSLANYHVYFIGPHLSLVPMECPGELCVSGRGLASGYMGRPVETALRFTPNPFSPAPGERLYHTGDRGFYNWDGSVTFLGRADNQVKIRGFRIELGEIESVLNTHPQVEQSVALVKKTDEQTTLVGCVQGNVDTDLLRRHAGESLPQFMIPDAWIIVETLPLTPNRKIDKKALLRMPSTTAGGEQGTQEGLAPRTVMERDVAKIWMDLLQTPTVHIGDNFFDLGGHSLLATRLISTILMQFGVEIGIRDLFDHPTLGAFSEIVERTLRTAEEQEHPITPGDPKTPAPLTSGQRHCLQETGVQNEVYAIACEGALDKRAMGDAVDDLVQRHPVLGFAFHAEMQSPGVPPVLETVQEPQDQSQLLKSQRNRVFNLETGPACAFQLYEISPKNHTLVFTFHPVVCDAYSVRILFHDLDLLYQSRLYNMASALSPLPLTYTDYARWQAVSLPRFQSRREAWLVEHPPVPITRAAPSPDLKGNQPPAYERVQKHLSLREANGVKRLAEHRGVSPHTVLMAVFLYQLYRETGQETLSLLTTHHGRTRRALEGVAGCFHNRLFFQIKLDPNMAFTQLLSDLSIALKEAHHHEDYPFEELAQNLETVPDVCVGLENPWSAPSLEGLQTQTLAVGGLRSTCGLNFSATEKGDAMVLTYASNLYGGDRMAHFMDQCAAPLHNPDLNLQNLVLSTAPSWKPTAKQDRPEETGDRLLPLSPAQARLLHLSNGTSWAYNQCHGLSIEGPFHLESYLRALDEVIQRHGSLRTTFPTDGEAHQLVSSRHRVRPTYADLSGLTNPRHHARILAEQEAPRPFDPAKGPLLRVCIFRLEPQSHVLFFNAHGLAADAWSLEWLVAETLQRHKIAENSTRSPPPLQYADYAAAQQARLETTAMEKKRDYWLEQLQDMAPVGLPTDHARPREPRHLGATHGFKLDASLVFQLHHRAERQNATLFMVFLAAFHTFLARYSDRDHVVTGSPCNHRNTPETEEMTGCVSTILPLQSHVSDNPSFNEVIKQIRKTTLDGFAHGDFPLETLADAWEHLPEPGLESLYRIRFSFQETPELDDHQPPVFHLDLKICPFDLALNVVQDQTGIFCNMVYNTQLFEPATIYKLANQFTNCLNQLIRNGTKPVKDLPFQG